ncbi:helix-turn-helix transcriptional regulator [Streptomyces sp. M19]
MAPVPLERLIGQRLLAARNRVRWTLAEAAESVGVSVAHLSRLERGERQPSVGVLMQLARTYGVPLGQLVGRSPRSRPCARSTAAPRHRCTRDRTAGTRL